MSKEENVVVKNGFVFNAVKFVSFSRYKKSDTGSVMYFLTFMDNHTFSQSKLLYFPEDPTADLSFLQDVVGQDVDIFLNGTERGFNISSLVRCSDNLTVLS